LISAAWEAAGVELNVQVLACNDIRAMALARRFEYIRTPSLVVVKYGEVVFDT